MTKTHIHHLHPDLTIRFDEREENKVKGDAMALSPKEAYDMYVTQHNFKRIAKTYGMDPLEVRELISKGRVEAGGNPLPPYAPKKARIERGRQRQSSTKPVNRSIMILNKISPSVTKKYIEKILEINRYNVIKTSDWLNVSEATLRRYMSDLKIPIPTKQRASYSKTSISTKEVRDLEERIRILEAQRS